MKTLSTLTAVLGLLLLFSSAVYADRGNERGYDHGYNRGYDRGHERAYRYDSHRHGGPRHVKMSYPRHNNNWVVPLVVGGVLGYALSEPRRESVTYTSSVYSGQSVAPAGYAPQPVYQEQWVYFSDCDCQRKVLVQVR